VSDYNNNNYKDRGLRSFLIGLFILVVVIFLGIGISSAIERQNELNIERYSRCILRERSGMQDQNCDQYFD